MENEIMRLAIQKLESKGYFSEGNVLFRDYTLISIMQLKLQKDVSITTAVFDITSISLNKHIILELINVIDNKFVELRVYNFGNQGADYMFAEYIRWKLR